MHEYSERLQQLLGKLPDQGARGLERMLERVSRGNKTDYTTPYCTPETREVVAREYEEQIGFTEFEDYTAIDHHEMEKVGPISPVASAEERLPSLKEYWVQTWNPDESSLAQAVSKVCGLIPERSLRPSGMDLAFKLMPKDTNLGLPWFTRDRKYAQSYLDRARLARSPDDWFPCVWFERGQSTGMHSMPKNRDVWGFDHIDTILCATILTPILNQLKLLPGFSAWLGDVYVDEEATRILRKANGIQILSGDHSGFDKHLSRQLMDLVDDIWMRWFVESASATIRLLGEVCATVPIVVPYDILADRNGAMPSGHGLTNCKDSIANLIAIFYVAFRLRRVVLDYMVLGDDFVVLFDEDVSPDDFSTTVAELGLESNPSKQFVSRDALHYLQRWHSLRYVIDGLCVGCHSPYRSLSGLLGYERLRDPDEWSGEMDFVRTVMQVEVLSNDPRHRKVCEWVFQRDKFMQEGVDPSVLFKRAGGAARVRTVLHIASFPFNVKNPDKFMDFKTIRVLRALLDRAR